MDHSKDKWIFILGSFVAFVWCLLSFSSQVTSIRLFCSNPIFLFFTWDSFQSLSSTCHKCHRYLCKEQMESTSPYAKKEERDERSTDTNRILQSLSFKNGLFGELQQLNKI